MMSLSLSLSLSTPTHCFASYNKQRYALGSPQCHQTRISHHKLQHRSSFLGYNPLRVSIDLSGGMMRKRRGGAVCYVAALTPTNLQWVCAISSLVLMIAKGTAIHKSFLVPLFALQAPTTVVSWIQGEYGIWSAFLALIARLFFSFPGELELPFVALLMVIVAPYQVANLRGTKEGVILSLAIAAYLGFQHFTRAGSLQKAFDQGSIIATLAIICIVAMPCLLLI
ncbi:cold-regulated 413 inner membrane protein 1, chloroplastic [Nicotiana tabacum]|uniref:Cold-regulated 413 inner membrane protein 1, chloroplastic n=2 Tax=Nicotiana TaxID=4085 RepID=A0A1S4B777_TOBAC|nr:PREDICTED: cold-regulated 413 inner membrane protein 1, chloroplastic-like [Nicotiana sylvestris]XP_016484648.1 PREDICTED: cold-regulated 413 inner membrane protein 1, chloroplastic-like [Nicotiana tabacum]